MELSRSRRRKGKEPTDLSAPKHNIDAGDYALRKGDLVMVMPCYGENEFAKYPGIVLKDSDGIACFVHVFYNEHSAFIHWQQIEKIDGKTTEI
jgi:hypothetical protein